MESGYSCVDGKSLVGLFSLDISKPLQLTINDGEARDRGCIKGYTGVHGILIKYIRRIIS